VQPGDRIAPHLVLVRPLVEGGTGSVWVAANEHVNAQVAVKVLAQDALYDETTRARFQREAAAAMQVHSPHVVQILDYGINEQNVPYLVMELLEGTDLEGLIAERGALPPTDVVSIITQIAKGLMRAHEAHVLHRDVKSSNVFLTKSDGWGDAPYFAKLVDFGMAKQVDRVTKQITEQGTVVGTPQYMSPEQMMGLELDARSDLWSLAVVAFEALTGQRPFKGETLKDFGDAIQIKPLPKPRDFNPTLPEAVDAWFEKACARKPEDRFANARDFAEALDLAVNGTKAVDRETRRLTKAAPPPKRVALFLAIAGVLAVLAAIVLLRR
jgi:eukaryotic-like serine/threonine-protein kinase